jgi:hypothetical protein
MMRWMRLLRRPGRVALTAAAVLLAGGVAAVAMLTLARSPVAGARTCTASTQVVAAGTRLDACFSFRLAGRGVRLTGVQAAFTSASRRDIPAFAFTFQNPRTGHVDATLTAGEDADSITCLSTGWLSPAAGHGMFSFGPAERVTITLRATGYGPVAPYRRTVILTGLLLTRQDLAGRGGESADGVPGC